MGLITLKSRSRWRYIHTDRTMQLMGSLLSTDEHGPGTSQVSALYSVSPKLRSGSFQPQGPDLGTFLSPTQHFPITPDSAAGRIRSLRAATTKVRYKVHNCFGYWSPRSTLQVTNSNSWMRPSRAKKLVLVLRWSVWDLFLPSQHPCSFTGEEGLAIHSNPQMQGFGCTNKFDILASYEALIQHHEASSSGF